MKKIKKYAAVKKGCHVEEEKLWREIKSSMERDIINKSVEWLKSAGANPHMNMADVRYIGQAEMREADYLAAFNRVTGEMIVPDILAITASKETRGVLEHELFHRADYLEKFSGTRKNRKKTYEKWKETREMLETISKHTKTGKRNVNDIDEHPLYKAIGILESKGYNATESLLKLWKKDKKKFVRMLRLATAAWSINPKISRISPDKIEKAKKMALRYFVQTPVKEKAVEKYYKFLSEIPAYMVMFYLQGRKPEEGLVAAKILLTKKEYFGGTGMEGLIKNTVDKYARLALALRKAGLSDSEIFRAVLMLHKNVYTPEDINTLLRNKEMVVRAAHAVRAWAGSKRDVREGIAAQSLGRIEKIASKAIEAMEKEKRTGLAGNTKRPGRGQTAKY